MCVCECVCVYCTCLTLFDTISLCPFMVGTCTQPQSVPMISSASLSLSTNVQHELKLVPSPRMEHLSQVDLRGRMV